MQCRHFTTFLAVVTVWVVAFVEGTPDAEFVHTNDRKELPGGAHESCHRSFVFGRVHWVCNQTLLSMLQHQSSTNGHSALETRKWKPIVFTEGLSNHMQDCKAPNRKKGALFSHRQTTTNFRTRQPPMAQTAISSKFRKVTLRKLFL